MKNILLIILISLIASCKKKDEVIIPLGPSYSITDNIGQHGLNLLFFKNQDTIFVNKNTAHPIYELKINILDNSRKTKILINQTKGKNVGLGFDLISQDAFISQNASSDDSILDVFVTDKKGSHSIKAIVFDDIHSNKTFDVHFSISSEGPDEFKLTKNIVFIIR